MTCQLVDESLSLLFAFVFLTVSKKYLLDISTVAIGIKVNKIITFLHKRSNKN